MSIEIELSNLREGYVVQSRHVEKGWECIQSESVRQSISGNSETVVSRLHDRCAIVVQRYCREATCAHDIWKTSIFPN